MRPLQLLTLWFFIWAAGLLGCNSASDSGSAGPGTDNPSSSVFASKTTIAPGAECPAGGVQIDMGFDNNKNNRLDTEEIVSTEYVCNGEDGENAAGLNVSATVGNGTYLALVHNLGRDNLTFEGQFLKYGYIYDYTDYNLYFGDGIPVLANPVIFENASTSYISTAALPGGNVLVAYRDGGNSNYGTFVIYNMLGRLISGPTVFAAAGVTYISTAAFSSGNVLIAYSDAGNSGCGTYVIYNSSGGLVYGPVPFTTSVVTYKSVSALPDGNVVVAYRDGGNSGYGTYVIYNSTGVLVSGPTVFAAASMREFTTAVLANGRMLIASGTTFSIYNFADNTMSRSFPFSDSRGCRYISAAASPDGNVMIAYCNDDLQDDYPSFGIFNSAGARVSGPVVLRSFRGTSISAGLLSNGNYLVAYSYDGRPACSEYSVYNPAGTLVNGPYIFNNARVNGISAAGLAGGNAILAYPDPGSAGVGTFRTVLRDKTLLLQKVSSNEVRLWNYTGETLELMLSVNQ